MDASMVARARIGACERGRPSGDVRIGRRPEPVMDADNRQEGGGSGGVSQGPTQGQPSEQVVDRVDYDAELQRHNEVLRGAYNIQPWDHKSWTSAVGRARRPGTQPGWPRRGARSESTSRRG